MIGRRQLIELATRAGLAAAIRRPIRSASPPLLPFLYEGTLPIGTTFGQELDGRRLTDLSKIKSARDLTRSDDFYIRTRASLRLPHPSRWRIAMKGPHLSIEIDPLRAAGTIVHTGPCVAECAGNGRRVHCGLMSQATWSGIPLPGLLTSVGLSTPGYRVLISGFDSYEKPSATSVAGASWIFSPKDLSRAILATRMNAKPLSPDHGAPVRLVVPGWYGCCWIKWVNRIELVDDDCDATSQMIEYASRTGQTSPHAEARSYSPAIVEFGAVATSVRKIDAKAARHYDLDGLAWGGSHASAPTTLTLTVGPESEAIKLEHPHAEYAWTRWTHRWLPQTGGDHWISLHRKIPDQARTDVRSAKYARCCNFEEP